MTLAHTAAVLLALAQLADAYTTIRIIRAGGYEANPAMRWLADRLAFAGRWTWLIVAKAATLPLIWWLAWRADDWHTALLMVALIAYVGVIAHNVSIIRRLRSRA